MSRLVRAAVMVTVPALAMAQEGQVPAIQANAVAQAGITAPTPSLQGTTTSKIPEGVPPPVHKLSPSAPLNKKETAASALAGQWRDHFDRPQRGEDGSVRWVYGASMPSVVCAPLFTCVVQLEPGEVVNSIHVGDKVRWSVMPGISGIGLERTTLVIVKPSDAGLTTSLLIMTDKRTYTVKLVSTQKQWTPMTAFSYPTDAAAAWASYGAAMSSATPASTAVSSATGASPYGVNVQFYRISGSAPWKPERAYAQGGKTIIEFSSTMQFGSAPALIGLGEGGGWFSSAPEQMIQYRVVGNRYIVDSILDRAKLVLGVGSNQQRVDLERTQ